jgi:hypothetical protein
MGTVTVIRLGADKYTPQPVPEVGKIYHAFDDGKIRLNRHFITTILEVIPFTNADSALLKTWKSEVEACYWLYATETDYFIKASDGETTEPSYYVRTTEGNWFSLGWFGALLDIDGSLYETVKEAINYDE